VLTLAQLITFNVSSKQLGSANCVTSAGQGSGLQPAY